MAPSERATAPAYLDACRPVIEAARRAPGCLDFYLTADPLEDDRINVFERWKDVESVERFRDSGPRRDGSSARRWPIAANRCALDRPSRVVQREVDEAELAAVAFLARYSGRTLEA